MAHAFQSLSAWQVMAAGLLFFGGIYLLFGAATWLLTRHVQPALDIGAVLDPRPLAPGQLRRELTQSGVSVLNFGLGLSFPWGLLQLGWARLDPDAGAGRIALEILALVAARGAGVAHQEPTHPLPLHANERVVAQPGRRILRHPPEAVPALRRLPQQEAATRAHRVLHRFLEQGSHALHLDQARCGHHPKPPPN